MAKKIINTGSSDNAGNGDPLRVAFSKINDNFTELYTLTGGTALDLKELAQDYSREMITNGIHSGLSVSYDDLNNRLNFVVTIDGGNASSNF